MEKGLFFTALTASAILLTGCSSTPPAPASAVLKPPPCLPSPLLGEMQNLSSEIVKTGGLAVIGTGESKSLELALNMAKKNGRIELARMLTARIEMLGKAFSEETGIPYDSLFLSGLNNAAEIITKQQIVGSVAQTLKYESTGHTFTAYAIMVLDPKVIADQLAKETDLYAKLQSTKAFETLNQEITAFQAAK
ncbi:MAG: hypothetical protein WC047_04570 [Kiritimatiellales bacterium]